MQYILENNSDFIILLSAIL